METQLQKKCIHPLLVANSLVLTSFYTKAYIFQMICKDPFHPKPFSGFMIPTHQTVFRN